jgi:hypothetical protein
MASDYAREPERLFLVAMVDPESRQSLADVTGFTFSEVGAPGKPGAVQR